MPLSYKGLRYHWHPHAFLTYDQSNYAIRQLWKRCAGKADWAGDPVIDLPTVDRQQVENMFAADRGQLPWITLDTLVPNPEKLGLDTLSLPALCQTTAQRDHLQLNAGAALNVDLVAATFLWLSRWEENLAAGERDPWGNFSGIGSFAEKQGFLERPVLDEWALVLRRLLELKKPAWKACLPEYRVVMSHDMDTPVKFVSSYRVFRAILGCVLRDRSIGRALETGFEGLRSLADSNCDPFYRGFRTILEINRCLDLKGVFFFMTAQRGKRDEGYDLSSPLYRKLVAEVLREGHEVGWHPGYRAAEDDQLFLAEKQRMDAVMEGESYGARHHYLRWRINRSWSRFAEVGIKYDASLGFTQVGGFRCGTAHPFPAYDLKTDCQLKLEIHPLIMQTGALFTYQKLTLDKALEKIQLFAQRIRNVRGEFWFLVHNSETQTLKSLEPHMSAPLFGMLPGDGLPVRDRTAEFASLPTGNVDLDAGSKNHPGS